MNLWRKARSDRSMNRGVREAVVVGDGLLEEMPHCEEPQPSRSLFQIKNNLGPEPTMLPDDDLEMMPEEEPRRLLDIKQDFRPKPIVLKGDDLEMMPEEEPRQLFDIKQGATFRRSQDLGAAWIEGREIMTDDEHPQQLCDLDRNGSMSKITEQCFPYDNAEPEIFPVTVSRMVPLRYSSDDKLTKKVSRESDARTQTEENVPAEAVSRSGTRRDSAGQIRRTFGSAAFSRNSSVMTQKSLSLNYLVERIGGDGTTIQNHDSVLDDTSRNESEQNGGSTGEAQNGLQLGKRGSYCASPRHRWGLLIAALVVIAAVGVTGGILFGKVGSTAISTGSPTLVPSAAPSRTNPWQQLGGELAGRTDEARFGASLAMSSDGSVVAVGAAGDRDSNIFGRVQVYQRADDDVWTPRGLAFESDELGDAWGSTLALSGDGFILALGAYRKDRRKGLVRLYMWDGVQWMQRGKDLRGDTVEADFGYSLALSKSGDVLMVGGNPIDQSGDDIIVGGNGNHQTQGHLAFPVNNRVFSWNSTVWNQRGPDFPVDSLGASVAMSQDGLVVAIGDPERENVTVFNWTKDATWEQVGSTIQGGDQEEGGTHKTRFGDAVVLSSDGKRIAVGASRSTNDKGATSGSIQVLNWNGSEWTPQGDSVTGGEGAHEVVGNPNTVALSGDGYTLCTSAVYETNGLSVGIVRIYRLNGTEWTRLGDDIFGVGAHPTDLLRNAVALSNDGLILAMGAPLSNDNGNHSGLVRVYKHQD